MTSDISSSSTLPKGLLYGLGLAALWVVVALISSTTTYHLAPLIVAGTPAIVDSLEGGSSMARLGLLTAAGLALALALAVTGILSLSGNLDGPSLLPTGGAVVESVLFAFTGGLLGLIGAALISRT
jgi:hypothetical protein